MTFKKRVKRELADLASAKYREFFQMNQEAMKPRTIIIEVFQGVVSDVRNLPKGWTYRVIDHD